MKKYPVYSPSIYANTSGNTIPDHEHQVTQQQQGSVDPTSGMEGPLYLQVNNLKHWVELPDCDGKTGEVKLMNSTENATAATCKVNP